MCAVGGLRCYSARLRGVTGFSRRIRGKPGTCPEAFPNHRFRALHRFISDREANPYTHTHTHTHTHTLTQVRESVNKLLVGNKSDLESKKVVDTATERRVGITPAARRQRPAGRLSKAPQSWSHPRRVAEPPGGVGALRRLGGLRCSRCA
jgi:hypothetical protein